MQIRKFRIERISVLKRLFSIQKVEQYFHYSMSNDQTDRGYFILSLYLPNASLQVDQEELAAALGFAGHLVSMIALYLGVRLRYPLIIYSSRSSIQDPITRGGDKTYPLFLKGQEKGHVEYAIYLLNKNIEQLSSHISLPITNLRATLENVEKLLTRITR